MNLTSLITLPARLGYEVARRTLDVAVGTGRMVGLFGGDDQPAAEPPAKPASREPGTTPRQRSKPARPKPARSRSAAKPRGARRGDSPRGGGASRAAGKAPKRTGGRASAPAAKTPEPEVAEVAESSQPASAPESKPERQPTPIGSRVPGAVEAEEVTLISRVETEVLREVDATEIAIDVNPIGGVVRLTGSATGAEQVRELQRRALAVPGVKRVENELSVPDSPAPGPFHAERRTDDAEPLPTELADRGEGRQPAPLGASDEAPGPGGDGRTSIP